jgi:hypothetical protein
LGHHYCGASYAALTYSRHYRAQMGGVVAPVGSLVDITANLTQLSFELSSTDRKRLGDMASTVAIVRADLMNRRIPASIQFNPDDELSHGVPLLREMENTVSLIPLAFTGSRSIDEYLPPSGDVPRSKLHEKMNTLLIRGTSSVAHLRENLKAATLQIPTEILSVV